MDAKETDSWGHQVTGGADRTAIRGSGEGLYTPSIAHRARPGRPLRHDESNCTTPHHTTPHHTTPLHTTPHHESSQPQQPKVSVGDGGLYCMSKARDFKSWGALTQHSPEKPQSTAKVLPHVPDPRACPHLSQMHCNSHAGRRSRCPKSLAP